jgi:acyl-CoA thioesterase-1
VPAYVLGVCLALLAVLSVGYLTGAEGSKVPRCEQFAQASQHRAERVTGTAGGRDVVVIGDSWSVGLGLVRPMASWPSRLDGRVHVAGFSGSGFSATASSCGRQVAFAERAAGAVAVGPDLVVVQGGLNDFDQGAAAIRAGFTRLMDVLQPGQAAYDVVVVGPASAPSRAAAVPRVDRLLGRLAAASGVQYVGTRDLQLPYLPDGLHLTPEGHRLFGDAVAERISALPG